MRRGPSGTVRGRGDATFAPPAAQELRLRDHRQSASARLHRDSIVSRYGGRNVLPRKMGQHRARTRAERIEPAPQARRLSGTAASARQRPDYAGRSEKTCALWIRRCRRIFLRLSQIFIRPQRDKTCKLASRFTCRHVQPDPFGSSTDLNITLERLEPYRKAAFETGGWSCRH